MTSKELTNCAPVAAVQAEAVADFTRMMDEKRNLTTEYTYGRMTDAEFIENRKKLTEFNMTGWFGWDGPYTAILIARVLNKCGYRTASKHITALFGTTEEYNEYKTAITNALHLAASLTPTL